MTEETIAKLECPICGHIVGFTLNKEATIQSLEDMNWKKKVTKAINDLSVPICEYGCCQYVYRDALIVKLGLDGD